MGFFIIGGVMLVLSSALCQICIKKCNKYYMLRNEVHERLYEFEMIDHSYSETERKRWESLKLQESRMIKKVLFYELWKDFSKVANVVSIVVLIALVIGVLTTNNSYSIKDQRIENKTNYDAIVLKLKTSYEPRYNSDIVANWNIDYLKYEHAHNNFFLNVFYPMSVYDGTGYIELNDYCYTLED